jgi:hypothetical protein
MKTAFIFASELHWRARQNFRKFGRITRKRGRISSYKRPDKYANEFLPDFKEVSIFYISSEEILNSRTGTLTDFDAEMTSKIEFHVGYKR